MEIPYGTEVLYHGSIEDAHGLAVYLGPCGCPLTCGGSELETIDGFSLDHVGDESFREFRHVR